MLDWLLVVAGIIVLGVLAVRIGKAREATKARQLVGTLIDSAYRPAHRTVNFASFSALPPPVAHFFRQVLTDGQPPIKTVRMRQTGVLRPTAETERWSPFTATQLAVPSGFGFVWNAKVAMPLAAHLRVLDSYVAGVGSGRASLLSAFGVAAEAGTPELNSGALHRYLAEAVWFPTALLPQFGVAWHPLDDQAAIATLTDRGTTVSLEFRFNDAGEVTSIYSPGRFGRFDGDYRLLPWEGHFRDYHDQAGMRVPRYGEVGWYVQGILKLVWKGEIIGFRYEFEP